MLKSVSPRLTALPTSPLVLQWWRTVLVALLLFALFWPLYLHIGLAMKEQGTLRNNRFFHSDIGRVIGDMTGKKGAPHERTNVHPLFVLFTHPVGYGLATWMRSPQTGAVVLNSLAGAFSVALACVFFRTAGLGLPRAALGALLLGGSASHLYFGSAPETSIFSAISMMLLFWGVLRRPGRWAFFLPAGVFSMGVLITNGALAVLAYSVSLARSTPWARRGLQVVLFGVSLLVATAALSLVQKAIWPTSVLFFRPSALVGEQKFTPEDRSAPKLIEREAVLLRHVFVFDFFAPRTYVNQKHPERPALQFYGGAFAWLPTAGRVTALLWAGLLGASAWVTWRAGLLRQPLVRGLLLAVAFALGLHSIYGDDFFLYSANTCFCLLAWVLVSLTTLRQRWANISVDVLLALLLGAEIWNNLRFVKALVSMASAQI